MNCHHSVPRCSGGVQVAFVSAEVIVTMKNLQKEFQACVLCRVVLSYAVLGHVVLHYVALCSVLLRFLYAFLGDEPRTTRIAEFRSSTPQMLQLFRNTRTGVGGAKDSTGI